MKVVELAQCKRMREDEPGLQRDFPCFPGLDGWSVCESVVESITGKILPETVNT